jgi:hypothetical protein
MGRRTYKVGVIASTPIGQLFQQNYSAPKSVENHLAKVCQLILQGEGNTHGKVNE